MRYYIIVVYGGGVENVPLILIKLPWRIHRNNNNDDVNDVILMVYRYAEGSPVAARSCSMQTNKRSNQIG